MKQILIYVYFVENKIEGPCVSITSIKYALFVIKSEKAPPITSKAK
jgi:hypothetical protein